ncbi:hypothetical protein Bhyg_14341, partial [Pseudolycoriella hygida]
MWGHFTVKFDQKENAEIAYCNHCTKTFKLGGMTNASTGNLIRHMRLDHPGIYSKGEKPEEKFVFSKDRYRESIIKWIVNSDQPFCECQQNDFVNLLKSLNPDAPPLSAQ